MKDLKESHKRVAEEYVRNGNNGVQAYLSVYTESGYKAASKSWADLLDNPRFDEYLKELQSNIAEAAKKDLRANVITQARILKELQDDAIRVHRLQVEGAHTDEEILFLARMNDEHGIKFANVIKAIEALNKVLQIGKEEKQPPTQNNIQINFAPPPKKTYPSK